MKTVVNSSYVLLCVQSEHPRTNRMKEHSVTGWPWTARHSASNQGHSRRNLSPPSCRKKVFQGNGARICSCWHSWLPMLPSRPRRLVLLFYCTLVCHQLDQHGLVKWRWPQWPPDLLADVFCHSSVIALPLLVLRESKTPGRITLCFSFCPVQTC